LEDVYITLNTTTLVVEVEKQKDRLRKDRIGKSEWTPLRELESRPLSVLETLMHAPAHRMVLVGFPGTGKSTFVRYLALRMAQELCGQPRKLKSWKGKALLPVAVSLGSFAESLPKDAERGTATQVEDFLTSVLKSDSSMADFAPSLLEVLGKEGGLFLFDGLDEVVNINLRPIIVEAIEAFVDRYSRNIESYFLVTCRKYSYQDPRWQLTNWPKHELALLNDDQIEWFVNAWYDQHILLDQSRAIEYNQKKRKLLAALHPNDRRQLHDIARYPIILTVMAVVHANYELPDSRAQVYQRCVDLLLEKWNAKRSIMGQEQMRNLLAELNIARSRIDQALYVIAFEAHKGRDVGDASGGLVTERLVSGVMKEYLQDSQKVDIFLDYCQSANGLLMLQGIITPAGSSSSTPLRKVYTFPHMTFEEYLAGRYLDGQGGDVVRRLLDEAHDRWREAVKLLAEYLCFDRADRGRMSEILEALSTPFPKSPQEKDWRALWLAGELLILYKRAFPKKSLFEDEIIDRLCQLVQDGMLTLQERASAADTLDELGWLPDDLYTFVPIPHDKPRFYIARYPVINVQYRQFLEAKDFAEKEFWIDLPRFSESDDKGEIKQIGDWGDEGWKWLQSRLKATGQTVKYPEYWNDPRFGIARKGVPVVGVTWYEANAYCKWLLRHWDDPQCPELRAQNQDWQPREIRLPTDPEWIAAAGGAEPEDRFPWDKKGEVTKDENEIQRRANVDESGIGRTTPVGMYPLGQSPHSVWDLAGNVWEWQANYYDKDHDGLALRGGSWRHLERLARLSARDLDHPLSSWSSYGFRVVALPSLA
jgi:formylglycine-generating enzyme required for sulfatase activity